MSAGILGHGATLTVDATTNFTAGSLTTIGDITSMGGPDHARDSIDKSTMDSTNKWREFIPGMLDGGEVSVDLNYDGAAAGEASKLNAYLTNATQYWRITLYDHTTASNRSRITFAGFMTKLGHAIPFDDKVTQSMTLKVDGAPTHYTHAA